VNARFQFTRLAAEDLDAIWWFIAEHSRYAADRVEREIVAVSPRPAKQPPMVTNPQDITSLSLRFWTVTKFPNYVIAYRPETAPLQVVAVLHGKRDLKEILEGRSWEQAP